MRPDVKLGVVISMVVVLIAGGYYLQRDRSESAIPLAGGSAIETKPAAARDQAKTPANTARARHRPAVTRNLGQPPSRGTTPQNTPRLATGGPTATGRRNAGPPATTTNSRPKGARPTTGAPSKVARGGEDGPGPKQSVVADRGATPVQSQSPRRGRPANAKTSGRAPAKSKVATRDRTGRGRPASTGPVRGRQTRRPVPLVGKKSGDAKPTGRPKTVSAQAAVETHRVQQGDTMSSLAERYFGSAKYTRFLIASNPEIQDPNRLTVGMTIKIPAKPPQESAARTAATRKGSDKKSREQRKTYRVRPGDTFYGIAKDRLGDSSRWQELFELNKEVVHGDPKLLQVGQVLKLPSP